MQQLLHPLQDLWTKHFKNCNTWASNYGITEHMWIRFALSTFLCFDLHSQPSLSLGAEWCVLPANCSWTKNVSMFIQLWILSLYLSKGIWSMCSVIHAMWVLNGIGFLGCQRDPILKGLCKELSFHQFPAKGNHIVMTHGVGLSLFGLRGPINSKPVK